MAQSHSIRNKLLLPMAGGIVLYILMMVWADKEQLRDAFSQFEFRWLPVVLGLAILNYILRYVKFQYYLQVLGIDLKPTRGFIIFISSFVMAITPGKLGEVLKSVFIKDLTGAPKSQTAPIVVAERITDLLAFIFMMLFGVSGFIQKKEMVYGIGALFVLILIFCVLIGVRSFSLGLIRICEKLPLIGRLGWRLETMYNSIHILISPKRLFWAVAISIPSWSCEVLGFYLICLAMGQPVALGDCYFIYSVGTILGAVSFLPGGLGMTELSITALLTEVVGLGKGYGASITILIRLCTLWFAVILGGVTLFLFRKQLLSGGNLLNTVETAIETGKAEERRP